MSEMCAPIRYFGSKWRIADWIASHFPPHTTYVEVFAGSAAVLLRKSRCLNEVYNDIDGDIVHLFRMMREHPEELARLVSLTPFSREEFELSHSKEEGLNDLERARRTLVRGWMTRGGYRRTGKSWLWYQIRVGRVNAPQVAWDTLPPKILAASERLRRVLIERADWREILRRFDSTETLFYLDPPYLASTRKSKWEYVSEMGKEEQHAELLEIALDVDGMVVISGYRTKLYDRLLTGWERCETQGRTLSNKIKTECLWLSPRTSEALKSRAQASLWRAGDFDVE